MRPARLYLKIFLSFLLVLIIAEALIFGLFVVTTGRFFRDRYLHYIESNLVVAKHIMQEKLSARPGVSPRDNGELKEFLTFLGQPHGASIWLNDEKGRLIEKYFAGPLPEPAENSQEMNNPGQARVFYTKDKGLIASLPVETGDGGRLILYAWIDNPRPQTHHGSFALGLLIIGLIIALLIIPISRRITKPVKELQRSALRIAEGDLSHRATPRGKDEIGELGRAFNHMAQKVEEMIKGGRELTAHLSHELRSPLARIEVALELMARHHHQDEQAGTAKYIRGIREDIEQLDNLIGRILALSKIDLQQDRPKREPVDLGEMLAELLERYQPLMEKKSLSLVRQCSPSPPLMAEREALSTALSNIVDNAVKYSSPGGRMQVSLDVQEDNIHIVVTNPSSPPTAEDLALMFEPFQRWQQNEDAGSGLGLALTKKIISRHNGKVSASYTQEGLAVEVLLPVAASLYEDKGTMG